MIESFTLLPQLLATSSQHADSVGTHAVSCTTGPESILCSARDLFLKATDEVSIVYGNARSTTRINTVVSVLQYLHTAFVN